MTPPILTLHLASGICACPCRWTGLSGFLLRQWVVLGAMFICPPLTYRCSLCSRALSLSWSMTCASPFQNQRRWMSSSQTFRSCTFAWLTRSVSNPALVPLQPIRTLGTWHGPAKQFLPSFLCSFSHFLGPSVPALAPSGLLLPSPIVG